MEDRNQFVSRDGFPRDEHVNGRPFLAGWPHISPMKRPQSIVFFLFLVSLPSADDSCLFLADWVLSGALT